MSARPILLIGAHGQLGRELARSLAVLGPLHALGRAELDLTDADAIARVVDHVRPGLIVNAAAYTAVDRAESEPDAAFRVNARAPGAIAQACAATGALLLHYSTDYVFDGSASRPYREDDATAPLGVYGASKLAGEEAIRASGAHHAILRTAWVYAGHGRNFLLTMLRLGAERDRLRVVADQVGTPTSAALIADATARVLAHPSRASGTWHLTAAGQASWHGFAESIFAGAVERGLLPRAPMVEAISTAEYPTPAARPAYSVLDTAKLRRDFGIDPPDWRIGLAQALDALKRG